MDTIIKRILGLVGEVPDVAAYEGYLRRLPTLVLENRLRDLESERFRGVTEGLPMRRREGRR